LHRWCKRGQLTGSDHQLRGDSLLVLQPEPHPDHRRFNRDLDQFHGADAHGNFRHRRLEHRQHRAGHNQLLGFGLLVARGVRRDRPQGVGETIDKLPHQ